MAILADISGNFTIRYIQDAAGAVTSDIATSRALIVENVMITWLAMEATPSASTVQVYRMRSGVAAAMFRIGGASDSPIIGARYSNPANIPNVGGGYNVGLFRPTDTSSILATDTLRIVTTGGATQVVVDLLCVGTPQILVVS